MDPTAGDILFLDTNVLLTATARQRNEHRSAQLILAKAGQIGLHLGLSGQILREYLVVATRPREANGLGMDVTDALANIDEFLRHCVFYDETGAVSMRLRTLVRTCELSGKRIHDGNIAATMSANGLRFLLSQNPDDFVAFSGLQVIGIAQLAKRIEVAEGTERGQ